MKLSTALISLLVAIIGVSGIVASPPDAFAELAMREEPQSLETRYFDEDFEFSRDFVDFDEELVSREYVDEYDAMAARDFDDVEVYSRDYEVLEARNPALIRAAVQGIKLIVNAIKDGIKRDKDNRSKFTQDLVGRIRGKYPGFNVVVCHTKHETQFEGVRNKDWGHMHEEFDVKIGGTVGYEIYWFKKGTFIRKGDGGYLNWAYSGKVAKKEDGGKRVTFSA